MIFIILCLKFKSFIHFELIVAYKIRVEFHSPEYRDSSFLIPFFEKAVISLLCILGNFIRKQLAVDIRLYSCALSSVPLVNAFFYAFLSKVSIKTLMF